MDLRNVTLLVVMFGAGCGRHAPTLTQRGPAGRKALSGQFDRVLLLSIDGMHSSDLADRLATHPDSALAALARAGVDYEQALTSAPSDSFPGLLSMVTGGSPATTGIYYDNSYARELSPPGSDCSTIGAQVVFDEAIDVDPSRVDGGGIDPMKLPRDPQRECAPVYPHQYLRVNTVFEVVKQAGLRTAWADKHPAYELLNGPSGTGVDDLYAPEIAAAGSTVTDAEANDDLKVQAVLDELTGMDHAGSTRVGIPALLGMNFQAVSVAQKTSGYDEHRAPTAALADAFDHTDAAIGRMVAELDTHALRAGTLVVVTAKHGQSPIDRTIRRIVDAKIIPGLVNQLAPGLLAHATEDDGALLWLSDGSRAGEVAAQLLRHREEAGLAGVLVGAELARRFGDPATDPRAPDLVVVAQPGVIYAAPTAQKVAEHGGISADDRHVPLLVAAPSLERMRIDAPVSTRQIAPTVLSALGLDPYSLSAVQLEGTAPLPSLE